MSTCSVRESGNGLVFCSSDVLHKSNDLWTLKSWKTWLWCRGRKAASKSLSELFDTVLFLASNSNFCKVCNRIQAITEAFQSLTLHRVQSENSVFSKFAHCILQDEVQLQFQLQVQVEVDSNSNLGFWKFRFRLIQLSNSSPRFRLTRTPTSGSEVQVDFQLWIQHEGRAQFKASKLKLLELRDGASALSMKSLRADESKV